MGKINVKDRDGVTRVLYQKSNLTILTQSRTCSGVSQLYTKSDMLKMKDNLSETKQYYIDGGKIKRDLSIETNNCIVRRYCMKIKNKLSVQEGSKSKYSTVVDTEIGTIDEFEADSSACGDSEPQNQSKITNVNFDVAKLFMDNFKELLNNWIKQHLLENKETKEKLETVLYSIIHKTERLTSKTPANKTTSRSTYLLNRDISSVNKKKVKTATICDCCKNKYANKNNIYYDNPSHSSPVSLKKVKVISTLSIPRNLHKKEKGSKRKSNYKIKRTRPKNLVLSIKKSSVMDFSSYDFLSVSAEAFTKRCTNIISKKGNNTKKKRHIVFFPKAFVKSDSDSSTEEKYLDEGNAKNNLAEMPSLVQSIYAGTAVGIDSSDNASISKNDNFTMTDNVSIIGQNKNRNTNREIFLREPPTFYKPYMNELDQSEPLITIDFINEASNSSTSKTKSIRSTSLKEIKRVDDDNIGKRPLSNFDSKLRCWKNKPKRHRFRTYNKVTKFQNIQCKQFTFLYKKSNSRYMHSKRFVEHFHKIMRYFDESNINNDLKLNIHINVVPLKDVTKKDDFTEMSQEDISVTTSDTIVYNIEPKIVLASENNDLEYKNESIIPEETKVSEDIIPILDGTLSHSKYLLKTRSSITDTESETIDISNDTTTNKDIVTEDHATSAQLGLLDDIRELKTVIKDLTKAAEAFLRDHLNNEPKIYHLNNNTTCTEDTNISKGIQISNETAKQNLISGIKLSKGPKKTDTGDFIKRIMQKSASYNVIDSEMVLRVTDMTSAANTKKSSIILKCKPKSKSLIELTNGRQQKKLITYYCDGGINPDSCSFRPQAPCAKKKFKKWRPCPVESEPLSIRTEFSECASCIPKRSTGCCNFDDDDDDDEDEEKGLCPAKNIRRKGMGFGEGCVYCLLLWIPVIIILCLFYNYVVSDVIVPSPNETAHGFSSDSKNNKNDFISKGLNGSIFYVKLSDLGF